MAIKKSELYSTLWRSCDELRGGMDASQYKNYVLTLLFVKYVSDKAKYNVESLIEVPEGCSFDDMVNLKGKTNIGEQMNIKLAAWEEANDLDGMFKEADFSDESKLGKGKDLVQTVSNLIGIFQSSGLNFGKNQASDDDLMGDAYEYLMKHFATESGKSKGQFYTPAEVSRVMAKVIGLNKETRPNVSIYDPTCGSASLLLRALSEASNGAALYGQEYDITTVGLAKMNMILHGYETYDIRSGDTLNNPQFIKDDNLTTFSYAVANPPFSQKSWLKSAKTNDKYERWNEHMIGVPPEKNGDYAFLLHIIRSLKDKGKGACILPHGVLFRGNAEADIRKYLIKRGYIKGIIGLPSNLFYGTGIPACIIIIDKEDAASRKGIFMIDAKNGFVKDGNKNRLREQDIRRIVDTWDAFENVLHYARFVKNEEIKKNEYNLNLPRYIDAENDEVIHNIEAHLKGGIPEHDIKQFYRYWEACPSLQQVLFKKDNRKGFFQFIPDKQNIKETINNHPDFDNQHRELFQSFAEWSHIWSPQFETLRPNSFNPKQMIEDMGDSVLEKFANSKLVDKYDVYDQLMNYCAETLQDDLYLIESDGWKVQTYVPQPIEKKKKEWAEEKPKKEKEAKTIKDIACDLLPVDCIVDEYFSTEKEKIAFLEEKLLSTETNLNELVEEYSDSYLDASNYADNKLNKGNVQKRLKIAEGKEAKILQEYINHSNIIAGYKKQLKDNNSDLLEQVLQKYTSLSEEEIKKLVTNKWLVAFGNRLASEIQQVSQSLNSQLESLEERYEQTLPEINKEVDLLETKVMQHLEKMGFQL
ncbi:type I restriction-modification system subunit M [Bacteroides sp. GM023]|mgnify:FL=1|jgi:type I restriction enzyme M protein|uniref:type I restriction-modification system subunit M n=1 Tax=Bacteroides sp. GM023 TaxID=2723058 RepID=UPI00168AAB9E|nr:type I restriction-modification system subunit M [Bacteroides sp. GM023]MBD3592339.1 type I restriction-modification system subunit M [Bacteroides sp. GM023]